MRTNKRKAFIPDRIFRRLADIDIDCDIIEKGLRLVILDIDGTVKNRILRKAPDDTFRWAKQCKEQGLFVCLLSNDKRNRHIEFANDLDLPLIDQARKPTPHAVSFILDEYGVRPDQAVVIGNNPFTDILCAHKADVRGYWVRPIETTRNKQKS